MAELDFGALEETVLDGTLEPRAIVVDKGDHKLTVREEIATLEDEILREASVVVRDGLRYAELPFGAEEPLPKWIAEMGVERAWSCFRAAKANQMSAKEAPVGTKHAVLVHTGITKARATEKGRPVALNVGKVYLTLPAPQFPEKELDQDE